LAEKHLIMELYGIIEIVLSQKTIPLFKVKNILFQSIKYNYYHRIIKQWLDFTSELNPQI
jgi:hypothetical protein